MAKGAPVLPGLSPVAAKPVHAAFDGGRLTSDAGVWCWSGSPSAWRGALPTRVRPIPPEIPPSDTPSS
jgi:hypothetical protein